MKTKVNYDIIVIGAGHAGCEAALATARMGLSTVIFTMSLETIGQSVLSSARVMTPGNSACTTLFRLRRKSMASRLSLVPGSCSCNSLLESGVFPSEINWLTVIGPQPLKRKMIIQGTIT